MCSCVLGQSEVWCPEVVPPFGEAVGFVNDKIGDVGAVVLVVHRKQMVAESLDDESFRGYKNEFAGSFYHVFGVFFTVLGVDHGVDVA